MKNEIINKYIFRFQDKSKPKHMAHTKIILRYMDAGLEPTKTLTPIHGYEKSNPTSLEEAVAHIEPPIERLKDMVWTAKRNSRKPAHNLTTDESASIHLYTMQWAEDQQCMYSLLNEKLRSENRKELRTWHAYLKILLTALYKLPSLKRTIWRGISGNVSDQYEEDFIWWGVSSCTETMDILERFIGRSGVRTIFMIECIHGKAIQAHSAHQTENEILLMPGTYVRVISKWSPADNLYMVHLQEAIPPCELVAHPFPPILPEPSKPDPPEGKSCTIAF